MTVATADETLVRILSRTESDDRAHEAAASLLSDPRRDEEITRLYPLLIRHKTLDIALGHLEKAGLDVESVCIPGRVFRSEWPYGLVFAGTPEATLDRLSLGAIRRLALEHDRLLSRLEDDIASLGHEFILLFGRALRMAYPDRQHGMSHDVDVFVPLDRPVVPLLEDLAVRLGFTIQRVRSGRTHGHPVAHVKLFTMRRGHHLSVDLLCAGRPAQGLFPPFIPDLTTRARSVVREDVSFTVPSPEDMMVMLAEKTHRGAEFTRRHFNDAAMIVTEAGPSFDWDYLVRSARRHHLEAVLSVLLLRGSDADDARPDVPVHVRSALSPGGRQRSLLARMMRSPYRDLAGPKTSPDSSEVRRRSYRAWRMYWFRGYLFRSVRSPGDALRSALDLARSALVAKMTSHVTSATAARIRELGPTRTLPIRTAFVVHFHRRVVRLASADGEDDA